MTFSQNSGNTPARSNAPTFTLAAIAASDHDCPSAHEPAPVDSKFKAAVEEAGKNPVRATHLAKELGIGIRREPCIAERDARGGPTEAAIRRFADQMFHDPNFQTEYAVFLDNLRDEDPNADPVFYGALFASRMYMNGRGRTSLRSLDLLTSVLRGAETLPGDDSPEWVPALSPGAVDASLARANDHLSDNLWKSTEREKLAQEMAASMRLARHVADVALLLRQPDCSLATLRSELLDLLTVTYYGGFLAGTDAAEAQSLVSFHGGSVTTESLNAALRLWTESSGEPVKVRTVMQLLDRADEFDIAADALLSCLESEGWKAPADNKAGTDEELRVFAAQMIRVGFHAAQNGQTMPAGAR